MSCTCGNCLFVNGETGECANCAVPREMTEHADHGENTQQVVVQDVVDLKTSTVLNAPGPSRVTTQIHESEGATALQGSSGSSNKDQATKEPTATPGSLTMSNGQQTMKLTVIPKEQVKQPVRVKIIPPPWFKPYKPIPQPAPSHVPNIQGTSQQPSTVEPPKLFQPYIPNKPEPGPSMLSRPNNQNIGTGPSMAVPGPSRQPDNVAPSWVFSMTNFNATLQTSQNQNVENEREDRIVDILLRKLELAIEAGEEGLSARFAADLARRKIVIKMQRDVVNPYYAKRNYPAPYEAPEPKRPRLDPNEIIEIPDLDEEDEVESPEVPPVVPRVKVVKRPPFFRPPPANLPFTASLPFPLNEQIVNQVQQLPNPLNNQVQYIPNPLDNYVRMRLSNNMQIERAGPSTQRQRITQIVRGDTWTCPKCRKTNKLRPNGAENRCEICKGAFTKLVGYFIPTKQLNPPLQVANAEVPPEEPEPANKFVIPNNEDGSNTYQQLLDMDSYGYVANTEKFECKICFVEYERGEGVVLRECLHTYCKDCLANVIEHSENPEVKCPYTDDAYTCDALLQEREIRALVTKEIYEKYLAKSVRLAANQLENAFQCKTPDCTGWCTYEDDVNVFHCPVCKLKNCITCRANHQGLNCLQYQERLSYEDNPEGKETLKFLKSMVVGGNAMHCPKCQVIIMKKDGCDALTCTMCRTEICWVTRGPRWGPMGKGDTSAGCKCKLVFGKMCHPLCRGCH